jgi:hypothetical protein
MNNVTFDPAFLSDKVKRDYSDHKTALVREFLQNSVDAGATEVHFDFDKSNRVLTVRDNGCGMDPEIMENALFKIGGSHKNGNAVGGFGSAKMILYFQHVGFAITTCKDGTKWRVTGEGSTYNDYENLGPCTDSGTIAEIEFDENWAMESYYSGDTYDTYNDFEQKAIKFLKECEVPAKVFWNDELIEQKPQGSLVRSIDWCNIYSRPDDSCDYIHVRIKGIKMFSVYMPNLNQYMTIELTSNSSLNILTTNRDGLKLKYNEELTAIVEELAVDGNSFKNKKGSTITYSGANKSTFQIAIDVIQKQKEKLVNYLKIKREQAYERNDMEEYYRIDKEVTVATDLENEKEIKERLEEMQTVPTVSVDTINAFVTALKVKSNIRGFISDTIESLSENFLSKTEHDFVIMYQKDTNFLPKNMDPAKGLSPKYTKLAKVYLHALKFILNKTNDTQPFRIGWVISDDALAVFSTKNGQRTFLINPEKVAISTEKRKSLKRIFRLAAHELTHAKGYEYHNEQFMLKYDDLLEFEDDISNWITFEKEAMKETI